MLHNREFSAGEARPGARELNGIADELERLGRLTVLAPLVMVDSAAGTQLGIDLDEHFWIKLTSGGTGGKYAWTLQVATSGGGWANDPSGRTGTTTTDPAYELNGNASVSLSPNPVVRAWRDPKSLALLFQGGTC